MTMMRRRAVDLELLTPEDDDAILIHYASFSKGWSSRRGSESSGKGGDKSCTSDAPSAA